LVKNLMDLGIHSTNIYKTASMPTDAQREEDMQVAKVGESMKFLTGKKASSPKIAAGAEDETKEVSRLRRRAV
jgi:hypothetical protein